MAFLARMSLPAMLLAAIAGAAWAGTASAGDVDFKKEIAPIFEQHCLKCHGPTKQKGGLRFDAKATAIRKGDSGEAAITPGKPAESELIRRISSTDKDVRMPPEGESLSADQIALLRRWIEAGAVWPETTPVAAKREMVVTDEDRKHWSFLPLHDVAVPASTHPENHSKIDRFIVAELDKHQLKLRPTASPEKLARRIYFDLIGLPPSPEETAGFVTAMQSDPRAAVKALVERLLATRQYGERWGRHWLDVARYADSDGQESDTDRPFAYQYRDFVIKSFNDDRPFDEFARWQIAGDELAPDDPLAVAATGFLVAGPSTELNVAMQEEKLRNHFNELDDTISTFGSGMLGLTLACTRCHDHKYDPIPTRDYYRLLAALESGARKDVLLGTRKEIAAYEEAHSAWSKQLKDAVKSLKTWLKAERAPIEATLRTEKIAALKVTEEEKATLRDARDSEAGMKLAKEHEKELAVSDDDVKRAMSDEQRHKWDELAHAVDVAKNAQPQTPPKALAFRDEGAEPKPAWLFHRADFYDKSDPVTLGFVTVLTSAKTPDAYWAEAKGHRALPDSTYQRAALANWLTDVDHGAGALVARVIVNRVWQHHFGYGLVRTPSDFGAQGERPTHPELLEWLARDFVSHGWKLKRLHRQIMLSAAYLQDDAFDEAAAKIDPDDRLLWRRRPMRLEADVLRDAMLATAGTLNLESYGPGFKPPIAAEAMVARNIQSPYNAEPADSHNIRRRSVYMFHKRVIPYPLLQIFDEPSALQSCSRRDTTTVAPQALAILNDPFVRKRATEFAQRLLSEGSADDAITVRRAFAIALARAPSESEQQTSTAFLQARTAERQKHGASEADARRAALADFCQAIFGLNEFLYVD